MDAKNHHLHKPVYIGEVKADGQFQVVWKTDGPIKAEAWSPYIPDDKGKVADWTLSLGLRQLHGTEVQRGRGGHGGQVNRTTRIKRDEDGSAWA